MQELYTKELHLNASYLFHVLQSMVFTTNSVHFISFSKGYWTTYLARISRNHMEVKYKYFLKEW